MRKKILIVDDDILLHRLMRHQLEQEGFISLHAINGREALNLAFAHQPDAIVLDIVMEGLDGISVLRELRRNLLTHDTPILMITSSTLEIARKEAALHGVQQFLVKPFGPAQLARHIRNALSPADAPAPQAR
ncbi:MAG: response regulator [Verrucomicrobia bacterium]|nr:MAG: response regulator [Verrucomicrobiota bacterium]